MSTQRVRLVIWCEDRRQEQFLRSLFATSSYGLTRRDLTVHLAPSGIGSAAQWVAANFHKAMQLARAQKHQRRLGILVMIDGDNEGVLGRKRQLLVPPHHDRDQLNLAIWVPTRNIETWVKFLAEQSLDVGVSEWEVQDFKDEVGRHWDQALAVAIGRWSSAVAPQLTSLVDAHQELARLPFK